MRCENVNINEENVLQLIADTNEDREILERLLNEGISPKEVKFFGREVLFGIQLSYGGPPR